MGNLAKKSEASEKRAYKRLPIAIAGKAFCPSTGSEQDCIVTDISLGGATLQCDERPAVGTELVLYLPGFDRCTGVVTRSNAEESGLRFEISDSKRERMAEKILLYLAGALSEAKPVTRASVRVPMNAPRSFTRPNGEVVRFEVRDISLTGASLTTPARPPKGEIVKIGNTSGRVTRHFDEGIAVEFVQL